MSATAAPVRPRGSRVLETAPCPKTLREVKYKCAACDHISVFRFLRDYLPFRNWFFTCGGCRRYQLHRALGRIVTGRWR